MTTRMKPAHPGRILREYYLKDLGISQVEFANCLGVSRKAVSKIVNEHGSVTPEMALRFSRALGTSADLWLNLQKNYDLWVAEYESTSWQSVCPLPVLAAGAAQ